jgi:hypothetical protein
MRVLRGIAVGFLGFVLWVIASIFGAFSFIGEHGFGQDFDLSQADPFWSFLMIVGFLVMFAGPIYYWVIEPVRDKGRTQRQYFAGPRPVPRTPIGQISSFCSECGTQNVSQAKFCPNCGANLLVR